MTARIMTDERDLIACTECDGGSGRWYDPSHGCSRRCEDCNGTGKMKPPTYVNGKRVRR